MWTSTLENYLFEERLDADDPNNLPALAMSVLVVGENSALNSTEV
jgi:hypothetical protein